MKYWMLSLVLLLSCQTQRTNPLPRFDKKSLETHFQTRNINLLIMWDQRIKKVDDEETFAKALKDYLNKILSNYHARILISGLDGNPPYFFLSSNGSYLPSDYSSLFYRVDRLDLAKFERRYNPNISILKSAAELINNFTYKKFFLPENDFITMIIATKDDENYLVDMNGQKYADKLEDDVKSLMELNHKTWTIGGEEKRDFTFTQLRLFVAGARSSCHEAFSTADRLFYAASRINAHYTQEQDQWQRQLELYDLCTLNFKNFFDNAHQVIENRYEKKLIDRELVPKTI